MATKVIVGDKTIVKKIVVGVPQTQNIAATGLISTLGDVDGVVNRSDGDFLRYDSTAGKWKNVPIKTAIAENLSITNVSNVGGTLVFDSAGGGVFTYTGPTATQIRQHYSAFSQNNDLTYDSTKGKFSFNDSDFARTDRRDIYHRGLKLPTAQHISFKDSSTTIKESAGDFELRNKSGNINILPNDGQSLVVKSDSNGSLIINASDSGGVQLYHSNGVERFTTTDSGVRIKGDFIVDSNSVINGTLYVKQATTLNSTLVVEDSAHIKDGLTVDSDLKVKGNLIVSGTLTSSITPANVREHFSAGGDLTYDSSTGKFSFDVESVYTKANFDSDLGLANTGQLPEGSNLYFTTARARQSISVTDNGGDGSLSYDSGTGIVSYTGPSAAEARLHISVNDVGGDGSLSYNNTSGVITYTGPSASEVRAHFSAGASLTYDAGTGQFTTNQALDSNSNVTFNQVRGPAEFIIDPAAVGDNTGTVKILGNLQVEGSQTVINSTAVSINDKNIILADSAADSSALHGAGITVGGSNITNKPAFTYSHADKRFVFNRNIQADSFYGNVTGNVTGQVSDISNHTTDALSEGSTNQYYTETRVNTVFGKRTTDSLSEGSTNQYYTDARARAAVSVNDTTGDGSLSYNNGTGVFTFVGVSAAEARAHFSTDSTLSYDSATGKFGLADTTVIPGTYGSSSLIPIIKVDGRGIVDSISTLAVAGVTGLTYDSSSGKLEITTSAGTTFADSITLGPFTTTDLVEGTNQYFTVERAQDALGPSFVHSNHTNITATYDDASGEIRIAAAQQFNDSDARHALTVVDSGGYGHLNYNQTAGLLQYKGVTSTEIKSLFSATGTGFTYDSASGQFTFSPAATYNKARFDSDFNLTSTDSLSEGSNNLYFTESRVNTVFGKRTTDSLSEGTTNKYYTDTRARNALTVIDSGGDGRLTYVASTGRLTYKGQNDSEFFQHLEDNGASLGELTYDSSNKFKVTSAFFTSKATAGTLSTDSDKILILDATDNTLKQAGVQQLATAAAGVGNTAKLLAFIGL
mgnify:CR=1 FL=1|tara:strand:- start:6688 stop:9792 length:3105 start_codon:yes stop_codon:yes gene_type:complete